MTEKVLGFLLVWERNQLLLHWCHKIMILLVTAISICMLWVLCEFWNDKWLTVGLSLKVFAPYWHLVCIMLMVIFSWPVSYYLIQLEGEARYRRYLLTYYEKERTKRCHALTRLKALQIVVGLPFIIVLLFLYVMPMGIHSPCIQEKEALGPKPSFIAHRGAPMLAPENTMMSFEKAVELGAHGLETDIHISTDNVPFLIHDHDLRRTTNIWEVKPSAYYNRSDSFSWDFLSTLNVGKWFLKPELNKPFYKMDPISEADKEKARNQKIPKLHNLLDLARKEKKFVIFDLFTPPRSHPARKTFLHNIIRVILDSKIEPHLILWLSGSERNFVRFMAPGFQHVGRLHTLEQLAKENITFINVDYKELFYNGLRDYKAANITINLYLVNKPWLFSLAWCSRIHSVTTDDIKLLSQIDHPHFFMTPRYYMFIWLLIDSISAIFIFAIFCFHWQREMEKQSIDAKAMKYVLISQLEHKRGHKARGCGALGMAEIKGSRRRNIQEAVVTKSSSRISESPWSTKALYPGLASSANKYPDAFRLTVLPKKEAKKQSFKKNGKPLPPEHTKMPFEPTLLASQSTLQTALPVFKMQRLSMPFKEDLHPETQSKEMPMVESSQESFVTTDSKMF
ncbi:PREDICTED: glycerophosphodiester phosphodiesterase domain-containing protein 4 [Chrysochloris asiatica]|uniref:Glycerophosphodiester phosphodiesterase domain-containing protein 4 n=1 Tax=Chrysochloris asiatica TaxID=185453 RepID=A0A9B0TM65_CHRAS|nr:PREDICTED: glycerophosphodiester phosphodiesterase domain-containing protein 4 [Chrysochloris asiatica]